MDYSLWFFVRHHTWSSVDGMVDESSRSSTALGLLSQLFFLDVFETKVVTLLLCFFASSSSSSFSTSSSPSPPCSSSSSPFSSYYYFYYYNSPLIESLEVTRSLRSIFSNSRRERAGVYGDDVLFAFFSFSFFLLHSSFSLFFTLTYQYMILMTKHW